MTSPSDILTVLTAGSYAETLELSLAQLHEAATIAERDGRMEYARKIRKGLLLLDRFRQRGAMDAAIVEAMLLGSDFEQLRADAVLAKPLDSYRRSHRPVVSNDQIRAAMSASDTQADAAAKLGITERQLRTRLGLMRWNRKSSTSAKK